MTPKREEKAREDVAATELAVANLPEAQRLQQAIVKAMHDYADFLRHHNLIVVEDQDGDVRLVSTALVATIDFENVNQPCTILLKDGPIDRAYGTGQWPEPWGRMSIYRPSKIY